VALFVFRAILIRASRNPAQRLPCTLGTFSILPNLACLMSCPRRWRVAHSLLAVRA
jgi:hypothetical protein